MDVLGLLFSTSGRIAPRPFAIAILLVYVAGCLAQTLLAAPVVARSGLWPFALTQGALAWFWYALHAKRMHDAGRSTGGALGVAILYALSIALFLMVIAVLRDLGARVAADGGEVGAAGVLALISFVAMLFASHELGVLGAVILVLMVLAVAPAPIALGFTIYAATRPSAPPDPVSGRELPVPSG